MHEARLYSKGGGKSVRCNLCRHNCHIQDGAAGICRVRENRGGVLCSIFYGRPCALAVDPIEKKPLFHFYPGTRSFSIATLGCNFQCEFCQNWDISQYGRAAKPETLPARRLFGGDLKHAEEYTPDKIIASAQKSGCKSISYTYSEPTIFYEYARDASVLARAAGLKNIFVTNGYMTRAMLDDFNGLLDAANVDLKSFSKTTYRKIMKAELDGVLDSIAYMKGTGIWIEITTLIVPRMNDGEDELKDIAKFIAGIGSDVPWHISRFHPQYKMADKPPTPIGIMRRAYEIGKAAGLKYVYMGNIPGDETENTFCWKCGEKLIERFGFSIGKNRIKNGACFKCGAKIDGVF